MARIDALLQEHAQLQHDIAYWQAQRAQASAMGATGRLQEIDQQLSGLYDNDRYLRREIENA